MKTLLSSNLSTKAVTTGGNAWQPPIFVFKESLTLAFRLFEDTDGVTIEPTLDIQATRAAVGELDARPTSGTWTLQVGSGISSVSNTTATLQHDCTAAALAAAINAISAVVSAHGAAAVTKVDGSFVIVFGTGAAEVSLTVRDNTLQPVSFGRVNAFTLDEVWQHEVRLTQAPLAFTDTAERILPPAPSIAVIRDGSTSAGVAVNELQELTVPPDFRGQYYIATSLGAKTAALSHLDTLETIQAALIAMLGKGTVVVTNTDLGKAQIEFTGEFTGTDVSALTVTPLAPGPGDLTLTLTFDRAELLAKLRAKPTITEQLEVRIYVGDDLVERVVVRQAITITRPIIWPDLALIPAIDYLRPPSPIDYVPRSSGTVITGQKFYSVVVGNGALTTFVVDHGLATEAVFVWVNDTAGGAQLIDGTNFSAAVTDADSVTVTAIGGAPAAGRWKITVVSAQTVGAFAAGLTITTGQVTGLDAALAALGTAITALQDLAPTTPLGTTVLDTDSVAVEFELPDFFDAYPGQITRSGGKPVLEPLPRAGGLLPAIHDAAVTSITSGGLPSISAGNGNVYQNNTSGALVVPGGLGTRGSTLAIGDYAGSDGRRFFPLTRDGTTSSYFPRDYERELFAFEVSAEMLRAGTALELDFKFFAMLLAAITRMQAVFVIEHGAITESTSPGTPGVNLSAVTWSATPMLKQRLILTENKVTHSMGVQIIRAAGGSLSANKVLYGFATAAGSVPASANFALRGRVVNLDTENNVSNAKGIISLGLTDATATIA